MHRMQLVTSAFERDETRASDGRRERRAMLDWIDRIRRAVNDEKRRLHFVEPAAPGISDLQAAVVRCAEVAAAPIVVAFDESSDLSLLESTRGACEDARILEHASDRLG